MRPLDFLGRIKVKLGLVIVLAVATAFVVNEVGINSGLSREVRIGVAVVLALIMVQLLARGMTRPLREMARAAQIIAKGRYSLRVQATSRDEVGELARAFNAMAADLGEVDRQRRELVANVSHELRTPITGLRAVLENVVDGVSAADPGTMSTALAQTERLGRLVGQLLDLSRLDSGARLIEREAVELGPLLEQAVREAELARDDVLLVSSVPAGLAVRADPDLLAQVLANLLDNAVRHSPPDGTVTVTAAPSGAGVRLSVADQGPGIPAAARARVFERFSRLDAGRAADGGGAGLGLAIVKEIVELHGGSIHIDDCAGCRMLVDLPERTAMPPEHGHLTAPGGHVTAPGGPSHGDRDHDSGDLGRAPSATSAQAESERVESVLTSTGEDITRGGDSAREGAVRADVVDAGWSSADGTDARSAAVRPDVLGASSEGPAGARDAARADVGGASSGRESAAAGAPRAAVRSDAAGVSSEGPAPAGSSGAARADVGGASSGRESAAAGTGAVVRADVVRARSGTDSYDMGAGVRDAAALGGVSEVRAGAVGARVRGAAAGGAGAMGGGVRGAAERGGVGGVESGGGFGVGVSAVGGLVKVVGGGVVGLAVGFLGGVFGAAMASVLFGDGAAVVALVCVTALFGAVGASLGAGAARRSAEHAQMVAAYGGEGAPPVYTPPPLFPRPELPETPRWVLPSAAGAGVFAAIALPGAQVGLGIVLVAVVLGAAALPAVGRRVTPWTVAFGLTAYWLVAMAAVRDAGWLVGILLVAGAGLGALAVSGAGRGWLGVVRGGASLLLAFGPLPWFLAGPVKGLAVRRRILPAAAGLGITAVLLAVFGLLFSSADPVFAAYVTRLTTAPEWAESLPLRIVLFAVFAALAAAVVLVALRPVADPVGPDLKVPVNRAVWLVPLTAVNLLFAAFVAVQITALFGGDAWVLETAGLTYAEYARQGFFQLVAVSVVVLGIVAVAASVIRTERRERWVLAGQLGVLCALTMVVLFSALHRLDLYTDAYGLSRLRLSVEAAVYWLGALFALVLLAGAGRLAGRGSAWLPRTVVLVTGLALGVFAVVNPDLRVAESQVAVRGVQKLDSDYLGDLGAEAVPALNRLPEPLRSCVLADVVAANELSRPDPWNGWNLARAEARALLAEHPVAEGGTCPGHR